MLKVPLFAVLALAAALAAAFTARSMESRSTPGMLSTLERRFLPSIRKIGQIRSSTESVVSRTSRRDQSERRLRRSRVAGNPGLAFAAVFTASLARSRPKATVLSFGVDITGVVLGMRKSPHPDDRRRRVSKGEPNVGAS